MYLFIGDDRFVRADARRASIVLLAAAAANVRNVPMLAALLAASGALLAAANGAQINAQYMLAALIAASLAQIFRVSFKYALCACC